MAQAQTNKGVQVESTVISFSQSNFETGCFQSRVELPPSDRRNHAVVVLVPVTGEDLILGVGGASSDKTRFKLKAPCLFIKFEILKTRGAFNPGSSLHNAVPKGGR